MTEENLENKKERKTMEGGQKIKRTYNKKPREKKENDNKENNSVSIIKTENRTTRKRTKKEFNTEKREKNEIETQKRTRKKYQDIFKASKLKIIPLGGLHEVGKNITVFEYENEIIVVDCGLSFPEDDMLGVDLVIPDKMLIK